MGAYWSKEEQIQNLSLKEMGGFRHCLTMARVKKSKVKTETPFFDRQSISVLMVVFLDSEGCSHSLVT